jgi:gamma-D-glutamyl-L-lysine dipeptidyl-peptidase
MRKILSFIFYTAWVICMMLPASCSRLRKQDAEPFRDEFDSIAVKWVPDIQEGIFEVSLLSEGKQLVLKGETDHPGAKDAVISLLRKRGVQFLDSMKVLPDTALVRKTRGLVNVSVCNIRAYDSDDAELTTQALMGTPVRILRNDDGWLQVQTPDRYIGWVDNDAVQQLTEGEFRDWKKSQRIFFLRKTGDIFAGSGPGKVISDIVAGCILQAGRPQKGFTEVVLPDGRRGFIRNGDAVPLEQVNPENLLTPANLAATAESFMGIPYLWGGTSSKGFDCSGFVKTVYYLNGIILPRDASQQFDHGTRIRRSWYPDSLKAGDLLFFGHVRHGSPYATHVAMYLGDTRFIHASGMVKINSLDSTRSDFSRFRRDSFLGIRRIIAAPPDSAVVPLTRHGWYK